LQYAKDARLKVLPGDISSVQSSGSLSWSGAVKAILSDYWTMTLKVSG